MQSKEVWSKTINISVCPQNILVTYSTSERHVHYVYGVFDCVWCMCVYGAYMCIMYVYGGCVCVYGGVYGVCVCVCLQLATPQMTCGSCGRPETQSRWMRSPYPSLISNKRTSNTGTAPSSMQEQVCSSMSSNYAWEDRVPSRSAVSACIFMQLLGMYTVLQPKVRVRLLSWAVSEGMGIQYSMYILMQ